ncbi:MAG: DUF503 domain-containing protein [Acidimicrobiia bacterium]|nr:DUF503 domain-containing protein [Acidimicrobiia bacterium]
MHLPECRSLKAKRSVLKSLMDTARRRYGVSVSETDHQQTWQRAQLAIAVAASSASQADEIADEVERYVWSTPDLQVLGTHRDWVELT